MPLSFFFFFPIRTGRASCREVAQVRVSQSNDHLPCNAKCLLYLESPTCLDLKLFICQIPPRSLAGTYKLQWIEKDDNQIAVAKGFSWNSCVVSSRLSLLCFPSYCFVLPLHCTASCRRRLTQLPLLLGQCLKGSIAPPRALHLSPFLAEISKPRPQEEEEEPASRNLPPSPSVSVDTGAKVTNVAEEHFYGDELGKEEDPKAKEEKGEELTEMRLSWKELPKVYLKLSKSRLTGE